VNVEEPESKRSLCDGFTADLREMDFAMLLHRLHAERASGVLMLENNKKKKALQLREGTPVAVKSNLVDECLGHMLVRQGVIDADQATKSIERARKKGGLQGEILVAMDLIDEEQLADALRAQAIEKLYEIFSWKRGRVSFKPGKRLKGGNTLALEYSVANAILAGVRDYVPSRRIDGFFDRYHGVELRRAHNEFDRFQDVTVSQAEERVICEVAEGVLADEYKAAPDVVRRAVYGLVATGLVATDREPAPLPAPPAGQQDDDSAPEVMLDHEVPVKPGPTIPNGQLDAEVEALTHWFEAAGDKTHYELLEITSTAGDEGIREAYEVLARRFHRDRFRGASAAVQKIADQAATLVANAFADIATSEKRVEYAQTVRRSASEDKEKEETRRVLKAEAEFRRGEAALRARDYEAALGHFGQAVQGYPEEGEYHAHYGWALHLCNPDDAAMAQEAMEHVSRGIKLARDRDKPYLFLGRLCKAVGRLDAAEKSFTRAVQIRPECVEAVRELRLINMRREKGKGLIGRLLRR
jgi:curved DNA-binding protein CbpA